MRAEAAAFQFTTGGGCAASRPSVIAITEDPPGPAHNAPQRPCRGGASLRMSLEQEIKKMSQFVSAVDDAGFEREVLQSDVPVVLDFWAEWCPPCRALAPTFEELAKQYEGRVRFLKLNVDENQQVPQRFGIKGIPTLVFFDGGREVERVVGASTKGALERVVDKYVKVAA
jgi:thioredoxin 1